MGDTTIESNRDVGTAYGIDEPARVPGAQPFPHETITLLVLLVEDRNHSG